MIKINSSMIKSDQNIEGLSYSLSSLSSNQLPKFVIFYTANLSYFSGNSPI
jgi:hypothetical protein